MMEEAPHGGDRRDLLQIPDADTDTGTHGLGALLNRPNCFADCQFTKTAEKILPEVD